MRQSIILTSILIALFGCGGTPAQETPSNTVQTSTTNEVSTTPAVAPATTTTPATDTTPLASTNPVVVYDVGIFFDAEVAGLAYDCGEAEGVTDENGSFEYLPGEECDFTLGENTYSVETANVAEGVVTPFDLTESSDEGIELARVIQSLSEEDADGTLVLKQDTVSKLEKINLKDANATQKAIEKVGARIVKLEDTIAHLKENFDLDNKNAARVTLKIETLERVKANKEKIKNAREKVLAAKDDAKAARDSINEAKDALQKAREEGDEAAISAAQEALAQARGDAKEVKEEIQTIKDEVKEEIQDAKDDIKETRDEAKEARDAIKAAKDADSNTTEAS